MRLTSRAIGAMAAALLCASPAGLLSTCLSAGSATAATMDEPDVPLQVLLDERAPAVGWPIRVRAGGDAPVRQDPEGQHIGAVIVGSEARRLVRDAALTGAILRARRGPAVPCTDPGGAGLLVVTVRSGGGLELISIILSSQRGPSFDLAELP